MPSEIMLYLFSFLAVAVTVFRYSSYLNSMRKKQAKPHIFSWTNWGIMSFIGAAAQFQLNGGFSAWLLAITGFICVFIVVYTFKYGKKNITRGDKTTFALALMAIPLWQATQNPFMAILCLIAIDLLSYYPTVRKTWHQPWSEPTSSYYWADAKYFFALLAIAEPIFENMLYLIVLTLFRWGFATFLILRRRFIPCPHVA